MIPKTLTLEYPPEFVLIGERDSFLPKFIHTRKSVVRAQSFLGGRLEGLTLSSEYDALNDIYLEMSVLGDVGIVKRVWFEETV